MAIGGPMSLGTAVGDVDPIAAVMRRITDLEARYRELAAANPFNNATINNSGITVTAINNTPVAKIGVLNPDSGDRGIEIFPGGNVWIDGQDGTYVLSYLGALPTPKPQTGFQVQRIDPTTGRVTVSLAMADYSTSGVLDQTLKWYDRDQATLIADDDAGSGLSAPTLSYGPFVAPTGPTATTTSATFQQMQSAQGRKWNPNYYSQVLVQSNGTAAGEVRLTDEDGTVIGIAQTVATGDFRYLGFEGPMTGSIGDFKTINIEARVTSGTGSIGVAGAYLGGEQST